MTNPGAAVKSFLVCAMMAMAGFSNAQNYPSRPIRLEVPFGAGTGTDLIARLVTQKVSDRMGQPFVVENKPGARGQIAAEAVAAAAPDGYTLLINGGSTHLRLLGTGKSAYYEFNPRLTSVALLATTPSLIYVAANAPYRNLKEFAEYAKANPGKVNFANTGYASIGHMQLELIASALGYKQQLVEYKGGGDQLTLSVIQGDTQISLSAGPGLIAQHKAGKVRIIAVTSAARNPLLPDVPTVGETIPGYASDLWYGFFAPAGTPQAVVDKINAETVAALKQPDLVERLRVLAYDVAAPLKPAEVQKYAADEARLWTKALRETSINVEQ